MLTKDKITEIFCILNDFLKIYFKEIQKYKMLTAKDGKKYRNSYNSWQNKQKKWYICKLVFIEINDKNRHYST